MGEEKYFKQALKKHEPIEKVVHYKGKEYLITGQRHVFFKYPHVEQEWQWVLYEKREVVRFSWFRTKHEEKWVELLTDSDDIPKSMKEFIDTCRKLIDRYYASLEEEEKRQVGITESFQKLQAWDGKLD